jgi:hypothetical protein
VSALCITTNIEWGEHIRCECAHGFEDRVHLLDANMRAAWQRRVVDRVVEQLLHAEANVA